MTARAPFACLVILAAFASTLLMAGSASADIVCVSSYNPCGPPAISVHASGTRYGNAGQTANYSYTVRNEGGYDVTNVQVTDSQCSPVTPDPNDGTLNPGEQWTFSCSTTLAGNPGDLINHDVTATGDVTDYPSVTANTTTNTEITALSIVKSVDKAEADPGDVLTYTITVTNNGPSNITYEGTVGDGGCSDFANSFSLAGGQSATFTCTHTFDPWLPGGSGEDDNPYVNTACAFAAVLHNLQVGGQSDQRDVSACAKASTALKQHLHVKKTVDKSTADPYDQLNYTITVTNDAAPGGLSYEGTLNDPGCENLQNTKPQAAGAGFLLNPGDTITYTCDHNFNPGPDDGGKYTNEACAYAWYGINSDSVTPEKLPPVRACDSATTTLAQHVVTGRVFEDMNANGVQDAGEPAFPGVLVYADLNGNGKHDDGEPSSTSDGQGNYSLNIDLGTTTIREETPGGATCSFPAGCAYTVDLPKNSPPPVQVLTRPLASRADDPTGKDFGNWRPATVSGTVVGDLNGNGTRDVGENGVANILVYADLNGNGDLDPGEPSVNTAADGSYAISGLKPGAYVIRHILVQDGRKCTAPSGGCAYNLALVSNQSVGNNDFLDAPAPGQLVLPTRIVAIPHGFARLSGRSGCVASSGFDARVRSRGALRLVFFVDGKVVKSVVLPQNARTYSYRVDVSRMSFGRHLLAVRVVFRTKSNTAGKTLRMSFQRCPRQLRAPAFTG